MGYEKSLSPGESVDLKPLVEFLEETYPELVHLIRRCFAKDPAHRPSAADLERVDCREGRARVQEQGLDIRLVVWPHLGFRGVWLFAVSVLGWFHGEEGRQTMLTVEKWLFWMLGVVWVAVAAWVMARL